MDLKNRVVNLELSKKLKELGVKQDSYWLWEEWIERAHTPYKSYIVREKRDFTPPSTIRIEYVSAFTVAELGEMLPIDYCYSYKTKQGWECKIILEEDRHNGDDIFIEYADTEANARAKMRIYLIKNKLIKT